MIPLERQVSGLEWSKKLRELGVVQESAFYWAFMNHLPNEEQVVLEKDIRKYDAKICAAFTCSELGEMLPTHTNFPVRYTNKYWWCEHQPGCGVACEGHDTEADARAKILAHLLEQNLISIEDVNKRLTT